MFIDFERIFHPTPKQRIQDLEKYIDTINFVHTKPENVGKCLNCKHYIYIDGHGSEGISSFINMFCELDLSKNVWDRSSCENFIESDWKAEIEKVQKEIDTIRKTV